MRLFYSLLFIVISFSVFSQDQKPKLIVGIVVDQMRQEYLTRFEKHYGNDGFKRIMREGYAFKNMHYNYVPTYTGPGHASIYTGATPYLHGIIANNWYEKNSQQMIYCAGDSTRNTVGSTSKYGKMSPHNLLTSTIADEINISQQFKSQSIGVSIKDRGAIFPAGHSGKAYWYDKSTGDFITSDFYEEELAPWVKSFNNKKLADDYLSRTWKTLFPISSYQESGPDDSPYEGNLKDHLPIFPYDLSAYKGQYDVIPSTPFGNSILKELAIDAIRSTKIGQGETTDFLAISFSSTDYIGHQYGPNSVEIEDTYIRLDRDIADLMKTLDLYVGKDNYVLFITADHAVADVPQFLKDHKIPAGTFQKDITDELNASISEKFGEGNWIESIYNMQVFINHELCKTKSVAVEKVQDYIAQYLLQIEGISQTYAAHTMHTMDYNAGGIAGLLKRGYNQKRSGDVLISFEPGWFASEYHTGTTHGTAFTYDTHVPFMIMGNNIPRGATFQKHAITSIVPTLSMMLGIKLPNGAIGEPLYEVLEKE